LIELSANIAERFDLTQIREYAIELDPRRIDPALAQALAQIGFNRVSLGVQDFAPKVQEAIGRVQPFETVTRAVRMLREAGIANMNFDLMYGLPRQTVRDVKESAWTAATLQNRRRALFGYAHVPWLKPHQRLIDAAALPGAAERLEQAEAARTMLLALGYQAVGFDHFAWREDDLAIAARTGRLHRNFQGYTTDGAEALVGLGAPPHRPAAARLRAERAGDRHLFGRNRRRTLRHREGRRALGGGSHPRKDHRAHSLRFGDRP